jgi:hypothetical protein
VTSDPKTVILTESFRIRNQAPCRVSPFYRILTHGSLKTELTDWRTQLERAHLSNWSMDCDQRTCRVGENKLLHGF